jgi:hypothetical protein
METKNKDTKGTTMASVNKISFSSNEFVSVHSKKPSGYGWWWFQLGSGANAKQYRILAQFSGAKKLALKEAKRLDLGSVTVCP